MGRRGPPVARLYLWLVVGAASVNMGVALLAAGRGDAALAISSVVVALCAIVTLI